MTKDEAIAFLETLEASDEVKDATSLIDALRKTREEAKTNREALEEAQTKIEGLEKFKGGSKSAAIIRELKANGVKNPERIAKLMNADDIDFSDEGTLTGFDEQYELVQTDFPELLQAKRQAGNIDQFSKDTPPAEKLTATQMQLRNLREAHAL